MGTKDALQIIKKHRENDPELHRAYLKEKKNYQIGRKIREFRKQARLTQKQLAKKIGTRQSVISRLEHAEYSGHSLAILEKISFVLDEPIENFLGTESQNPQIFTVHIPRILRKAASFTNSNQLFAIRRSYA